MTQLLHSVNPATNDTIGTFVGHDFNTINKKLNQTSNTQKNWRDYSFSQRAKVIHKVSEILRRDLYSLAELATNEMGKPISQSIAEVQKCADTLDFYAEHAQDFLKDEVVVTDASKSYVTFKPMGVVLAIMPWNFPYWQLFRCAAPILMAGNSMLLKHASNVTGCALAIEKIFLEVGAPKYLFQTIIYPGNKMEEVIAHKDIAAVTFTGSTHAGRNIASIAGAHIKKQVLELGGSDAFIVLEDTDLKKTIPIAVNARLINNGQSCVASKRFIVHQNIYKEFVNQFVDEMKKVVMQNPLDATCLLGPMSRMDLRDELHQQVEKSVAAGAKIMCGGYIPDTIGAYYPATVLTNVKKGMPAYDEELFGPVAAVIKAKDDEHAIKIANDTEYGLGASIFSKNKKRAEKIAATLLEAGNCFVNTNVRSDRRLPFGGIKNSGYGRELGVYGIKEFVHPITVFVK